MINVLVIKTRATEVVNGFSLVKQSDCKHLLNVIAELEQERNVSRRLQNALDKANTELRLLKEQQATPNFDFQSMFGSGMKNKF